MSAPTVGVVAVTMPADGYAMKHAQLDERTWMVGYDPARLTAKLVTRVIREWFGANATIVQGVPA